MNTCSDKFSSVLHFFIYNKHITLIELHSFILQSFYFFRQCTFFFTSNSFTGYPINFIYLSILANILPLQFISQLLNFQTPRSHQPKISYMLVVSLPILFFRALQFGRFLPSIARGFEGSCLWKGYCQSSLVVLFNKVFSKVTLVYFRFQFYIYINKIILCYIVYIF